MSQKESDIIERAVIYLEKHEMELDVQMQTIYKSPTEVIIKLETGDSIRISNVTGPKHRYNLILGLKEVKKILDEGDSYYMFPMRMIDGLVAKISYDNKVRRGEISNER